VADTEVARLVRHVVNAFMVVLERAEVARLLGEAALQSAIGALLWQLAHPRLALTQEGTAIKSLLAVLLSRIVEQTSRVGCTAALIRQLLAATTTSASEEERKRVLTYCSKTLLRVAALLDETAAPGQILAALSDFFESPSQMGETQVNVCKSVLAHLAKVLGQRLLPAVSVLAFPLPPPRLAVYLGQLLEIDPTNFCLGARENVAPAGVTVPVPRKETSLEALRERLAKLRKM